MQLKGSLLETIFSAYGVLILAFLLGFLLTSFCSYFYEWRFLAPVFLTAFTIFLLDMVRINYQKPKIIVSKIDRFKFEESIRIYAKVENVGRSVAKYVKPLLSIESENLDRLVYAEYSEGTWFPCVKGGKGCSICDERIKGFLCPPPFNVEKNYLCWATAEVDAGRGLNDKPYCHVTNIAPREAQEVIVADVYRSEDEKTSVIKIADEYGVDWKPRICYRVDLDEGAILKFVLNLVGENIDFTDESMELNVAKSELKVVFKGKETVIPEFKEIKKFPIRHPRWIG